MSDETIIPIIKKRIKLGRDSVKVGLDAFKQVQQGDTRPNIFGRSGNCTATGYCYNTSFSE